MSEKGTPAQDGTGATDQAAQIRGAVKGLLVGVAIAVAMVAMLSPFDDPGASGQFRFLPGALFFLVAGGIVGWFAPRAMAAERTQVAGGWKKAALLGGAVGLLFVLLVFMPAALEAPESSTELWVAVALSAASVIAISALAFALGFLAVRSATARKRTLRIIGWTFGTLIALIVGIIVINVPDEDLLPEAKLALTPGHAVSDAENGFFVLVGMDAPAGEDPHAFGRKVVALWDGEAQKPRKERKFDTAPLYGGKRLATKEPMEVRKFCDWAKKSCLTSSTRDGEIAQRLLADNAVWAERYHSLLKYPKFEERIPPLVDAPFPAYGLQRTISTLRKAQCIAQVPGSQAGTCLQTLGEDIRIARTQLAGSRTLIGKMVAIGLLQRDFRVLAELMASQPEAIRTEETSTAALLAPLSKEEMDLAKVIINEFAATPSAMDEVMHSEGPGRSAAQKVLWRLAGKRNASLNLVYRDLSLQAEFARLPAAQKVAQRAALKARRDALVPMEVSLSWLSNPMGKLEFAASAPSFETYALRLDDLDGQQRLLRLQWQIVSKRVPPEQVPEFLKSAGSEYANPYTGKPMDWNPQTRTLSFAGMHSPSGMAPPRFEARI